MKKRTLTKGMLMAALICGCVQWGGTAVHAAELQEFTLDPMIVTAQRMETRDLDTPASVSVITAADIEKNGYTTTMEALQRTAGVTDYSYGAGGDDLGSSYSRAFVRGFDKGALVMLNGAPININNYASVSGIPVESIERIEVVKGANSVLYGAEALGGVVNIITKKGSGELKTTVNGTVGNYLQKWNVTSQGDGFIFTYGRDYVDKFEHSQMDRPSADTYRVNEKYQKTNIFTSLALSPNLQLTYNRSEIDPAYGSRKLSDGSATNQTIYGYEDVKNNASLVYNDDDNGTKTILSYNDKKVDGWKVKNNKYDGLQGNTSNYEASNIYFDTQKKWDIGKDTLIVGATAKHENYNQFYEDKFDNSRNSYGIYASYTKNYNDKFSSTLGVRGQYYGSTDFDHSYTEVLPQLQTLYKINETTSWYTNIGEAFELPAINAHASAGGDSALEQLSKHPVKPQTGWNYETGIKKITDTTATKLAVFHMDYKNKFAWKHFDWLGTNDKEKIQVNLGKFENTGIELEHRKILSDKFEYNLSATLQDPKSYNEEWGRWVQESAKVQFSAGVDYKLDKFSANLNCLVLTDREDSAYKLNGASTDSGKYPDHALRDRFKVNAGFVYRATDSQSFSLNMYNLLDRDEPLSNYEYYDLPFNWTLTYTHTF